MTNDLKPCPFCGGLAELRQGRKPDGNVSYGMTWIECRVCGCQTKNYPNDGYYGMRFSDDAVLDAWNRRASDD